MWRPLWRLDARRYAGSSMEMSGTACKKWRHDASRWASYGVWPRVALNIGSRRHKRQTTFQTKLIGSWILISSSWWLSSHQRLLLPPYWLLRSPYIFVISPFENSLFGWGTYGTITVCIWGAVAIVFATHFANVLARNGNVFIVRGESLGVSCLAFYIDVVVYRHWRPFTFVIGTEGLVTLVNVHASLRSFENMLACLFVFTRLVPGMSNLAWRLIRVRQYFLILYWKLYLLH